MCFRLDISNLFCSEVQVFERNHSNQWNGNKFKAVEWNLNFQWKCSENNERNSSRAPFDTIAACLFATCAVGLHLTEYQNIHWTVGRDEKFCVVFVATQISFLRKRIKKYARLKQNDKYTMYLGSLNTIYRLLSVVAEFLLQNWTQHRISHRLRWLNLCFELWRTLIWSPCRTSSHEFKP